MIFQASTVPAPARHSRVFSSELQYDRLEFVECCFVLVIGFIQLSALNPSKEFLKATKETSSNARLFDILIERWKPTVPAVLDHFNALLSLLHDNLTCVLMTSWNHGTSLTHQTSATRVLGDFKSFLDFFDALLDFLVLRYSVRHFLTGVNVFPKFPHVE